MNWYRFVWSQNFGEKLQIPKDAIVEALAFGKLRAVLVRYKGRLFITDRYALRKTSQLAQLTISDNYE